MEEMLLPQMVMLLLLIQVNAVIPDVSASCLSFPVEEGEKECLFVLLLPVEAKQK